MKIKLLHNTPLWIAQKAIRKCWASEDKSDTFVINEKAEDIDGNPGCGEKDKALIHRVGIKFKHESTLEHLVYNFDIKDVSRALLQEMARHRIASLSVKSTRYTLKELKNEDPFLVEKQKEFYSEYGVEDLSGKQYYIEKQGADRSKKYIVTLADNSKLNIEILKSLENLRIAVKTGKSNDIVKYLIPEAYKTEFVWTINARSLRNFLKLRTSKEALWEIRDLANEVYNKLPEDHKYLFKDVGNG